MCCLLLLSQLLPPAAALKFSLFQYKKGRAERGLEEKGRLEALLGENLAKEKDCWIFLVEAAVGLGFSNSGETNKSAKKKKRSGNDFRSSRFFSSLH